MVILTTLYTLAAGQAARGPGGASVGCGPARPVVWEGHGGADPPSPIPIDCGLWERAIPSLTEGTVTQLRAGGVGNTLT